VFQQQTGERSRGAESLRARGEASVVCERRGRGALRAPPPADPPATAPAACRSPPACGGCRMSGTAGTVPAARPRRAGGPGGSPNPLKQVLDAVGEAVECITYDRWLTYTPDDTFPVVCDGAAYAAMIGRQGGPAALAQWRALERELAPLQRGAALFPAAALRGDLGAAPRRAPRRLPSPRVLRPFFMRAVQPSHLAAGARGRSAGRPAEAPGPCCGPSGAATHGGAPKGRGAARRRRAAHDAALRAGAGARGAAGRQADRAVLKGGRRSRDRPVAAALHGPRVLRAQARAALQAPSALSADRCNDELSDGR